MQIDWVAIGTMATAFGTIALVFVAIMSARAAIATYRAAHPPKIMVRWLNWRFDPEGVGMPYLDIALTNEGANSALVYLRPILRGRGLSRVYSQARFVVTPIQEKLPRKWPIDGPAYQIPRRKTVLEAGEAWIWPVPTKGLLQNNSRDQFDAILAGRDYQLHIIGVIRYANAEKASFVGGRRFAPYRLTFGYRYNAREGSFERLSDAFFNYP